jgi:hypothetical protein
MVADGALSPRRRRPWIVSKENLWCNVVILSSVFTRLWPQSYRTDLELFFERRRNVERKELVNGPPRLAISTFRILLSPNSQAPIFHEAFAPPAGPQAQGKQSIGACRCSTGRKDSKMHLLIRWSMLCMFTLVLIEEPSLISFCILSFCPELLNIVPLYRLTPLPNK